MSVTKKILLIDDSKMVLSFHANILRKHGFECSCVENGFMALEECLRKQFDLILTDINMPKMDGYEFTRKIREVLSYKEIPIIMISTEQEAQDKSKGMEAGANVYIVKPVLPEDLIMHLKLLIGE
ncbi:MAG: response regulator [Oligoflexia bacterium]|nr:response regulator [Oligoflexia bacterium]MBF0366969.1 response regulator [Oligoflexia bacterium]